jgi:hypothetical protein
LSITSRIEKILLLRSSKPFPLLKIGGKLSLSRRKQRNPHYLQLRSLGSPSTMLLRKNTILLEVMTTCIQNGPHCGRKETKQCPSSQISSIPCAPSWVSKILSDIWCSSIGAVCIDTSRPKWSFWTSHPWARPTDMPSKSSKSSNKRHGNLGLGTFTTKARKGRRQPAEQRTEQRRTPQDNQSRLQAKKDT